MRGLLIAMAGTSAMLATPALAQAWDNPDTVDQSSYDEGYDDGYQDALDEVYSADASMPPPPDAQVRFGPSVEVVQPLDGPQLAYPPRVTTTCVGSCEGVFSDGYYYPAETRTTITIPARPTVTTTTTAHPAKTYVVERVAPLRGKTVRKVRKVRRIRK